VLGKAQVKAGKEPGELGKVRRKLLRFLEESQHYIPAELISSFPSDGMLSWVPCCTIERLYSNSSIALR